MKSHCQPRRSARLGGVLLAFCWVAMALWDGPGCAGAKAAPPGRLAAPEALRVLQAECFGCHNEAKKKGGLILTSREDLLKGGNEGPVVVPGNPESSRLLRFLQKDADPHMPPKKQLNDAQLRTIHSWIKEGVAWDASVLSEPEGVRPVHLSGLPQTYQPVPALALSLDGGRLAFGRGGRIVVHDVTATNFPVLAQVSAHQDAVQALAWSGDGQRLVSCGFRRVIVWNATSLTLERELTEGLIGRVTALAFRPDEDVLFLADGEAAQSGYVRVVEVSNGKQLSAWRAHADLIYDLDFSRDGRLLATAGGDKLIKIWDVATRQEIATLEGHTAQVLAVAFNTNASQLLSGGADRELKVWDIATREKIVTLGKHPAAITAAVWPGEGKSIAVCTEAGATLTYKNLKAHTGEQSSASGDEKKIGETADALLCLAASADMKVICAGSQNGAVHLWNNEGKRLATLEPSADESNPGFAGLEAAGDRLASAPQIPDSAQERPGTTVGRRYQPSDLLLSLKPSAILSLFAEPEAIDLSADSPRHGLLISALTTAGFAVEVTDETRFSMSNPGLFEISPFGEIMAKGSGEGVLTAHFKGKRIQVPVKADLGRASSIRPTRAPAPTLAPFPPASAGNAGLPPVSFVRDLLPVLSKAGCNAGSCHAKADGQNGFKLSVFSYDPKADYAEIVKKARGRRVFPAAPDESLIIRKPAGAVPHEGGRRFEWGSETHQLLVRWLREGMTYALTNEPALQRIEIFPKERRYRAGARQRLLVRARYSDGSVRDVTRLAAFDSNDKEMAKIDEHGMVTIGRLAGQGAVVARYMGFVADSQILVPAERLLPAEQYAALPRNNFVDELAYAQFQRLGLFPSELCTDADFLRRAYLDTIGVLPSADEVREFLRPGRGPEARPPGRILTAPVSAERAGQRRALIERLLARPEYADYWANKWADLLRPNPDRVGVKSVFVLDQWLRESFRANKPYDQFVREILLAEGTNHRDGPTVIYRDRREPPELITMFSQLFLGTRLECAKCHHHPNEKWSQDDFYQLAAYFGPMKHKGAGLSPPISAGTETFYFAPGGRVKHPVTGEMMSPRPLDADPPPLADGADPRRALANWLLAPENPFFARAAVNRVWANFFGRGLVEPVDDFRISNPCVNPPLLEALAREFSTHGYDLKHLIRIILESRLYQLSTVPNETNLRDTKNFARAYRRRLPAEVLLDARNDATGVPDTFAAMPFGTRASQTWSYKIESQFLDAFGRPNPSSDCPCERDTHMSVVQSLHLMNAKSLQAKLSNPAGRARRLADSARPPQEIVTELYLATLSRLPAEEELQAAKAAFATANATRQQAAEDVLWSLLNSPEFVFNH